METKILVDAWKSAPALVFTDQKLPAKEAAAAQCGAAGFLQKDVDSTILLTAVKKILDGGSYFSHAVSAAADPCRTRQSEPLLPAQLSSCDRRVLLMLMAGKSLKEIADVLAVSQKTAGSYRTRVYAQIKASNIAEAMRYCIKHQLQIMRRIRIAV